MLAPLARVRSGVRISSGPQLEAVDWSPEVLLDTFAFIAYGGSPSALLQSNDRALPAIGCPIGSRERQRGGREMASRRRRLVVLALVSGLISTLFVAGPTAAVAADPASLTVTATYTQGNSSKGQDITMQGNAPGSPNQLKASLLSKGTACPTTWTYESPPNPVVPGHKQQLAAAGPFSIAFSIHASSHPQLNDPASYHLCSYLVDAGNKYATLAYADTPLGTPNVGSASMMIASQGPLTEATSGTISVDVSGTTSLDAQIAVQALDDGKQCGAWYPDNDEQQYASAFETVPAGNFALQLEVTPRPPDGAGWETRPGYYKLCAYLTQRATYGSAYYEETPAATASLDHVVASPYSP